MKTKNKSLYSNYILNQNKTYNSFNTLKPKKNNKIKEIIDSNSIQFINRFQKNEKNIPKISTCVNTPNLVSKTITVPYNNILDDLLKYLENKINPQLYDELNNYINKKLNNYYLENFENIDKPYAKYIKVGLNKNKPKKRNSEVSPFSDKKYKSHMNFNILENNNIKSDFNNFNNNKKNIIKTNLKKDILKSENLLSKLMISNDCFMKKIHLLGNKKRKNNNNYFYFINNNHQSQESQISFVNYYNSSTQNIKDITYGNRSQKIDNKNNDNFIDTNEMQKVKIYKKMNPINKNNSKINRKNETILGKSKQKSLYDLDNYSKYIFTNNNTINDNQYKPIPIRNSENNKKYNFKINVLPKNNEKKFNFHIKNKSNNINDFKISNLNTNINFTKQNITVNSNLTQRPFLNKKYLINEKLKNKLKKNLNKYNHYFNDINKIKNKPYNLKNYNIFKNLSKINTTTNNSKSKTSNNRNNNTYNNLINKTSNIRKSYISSMKKTKSYRMNNSTDKRTILSLRKKSIGLINGRNKLPKLDKNNFLNIVNNITNKKNILDKKYIHINSIEINNIIKNNEKSDFNENKTHGNNNINTNINITNEEMMKEIKNTIDDNLKIMLNFSYENFLSKESERESKDLNYNYNCNNEV